MCRGDELIDPRRVVLVVDDAKGELPVPFTRSSDSGAKYASARPFSRSTGMCTKSKGTRERDLVGQADQDARSVGATKWRCL